jgi:hypothetical protein
MGHLYRYESLIGLSLFLTVSMLPFRCINEMITFSLKKKKKKNHSRIQSNKIAGHVSNHV